jgi:hypothetical protein
MLRFASVCRGVGRITAQNHARAPDESLTLHHPTEHHGGEWEKKSPARPRVTRGQACSVTSATDSYPGGTSIPNGRGIMVKDQEVAGKKADLNFAFAAGADC